MRILPAVNNNREEDVARTTERSAERMATVTAELVVKYLTAVATPQNVCVEVWFSEIKGLGTLDAGNHRR